MEYQEKQAGVKSGGLRWALERGGSDDILNDTSSILIYEF